MFRPHVFIENSWTFELPKIREKKCGKNRGSATIKESNQFQAQFSSHRNHLENLLFKKWWLEKKIVCWSLFLVDSFFGDLICRKIHMLNFWPGISCSSFEAFDLWNAPPTMYYCWWPAVLCTNVKALHVSWIWKFPYLPGLQDFIQKKLRHVLWKKRLSKKSSNIV